MPLYELRFHGRGGQGAVTAAELMVDALNREGKYAQAFPLFAGERRGAPVQSFLRIDEKPILIHQQCYTPDACVVLDQGLVKLIPWHSGLKAGGAAVLNWKGTPEELEIPVRLSKLALVDATDVSIRAFGRTAMPITNTSMLGAFAKTTGLVKLESLFEAVKHRWRARIADRNVTAIKIAYEETKVTTP
ncbi:MAG: 2-oxoacid:acceptor oxidoreductase family protein [Candidatus Bathyarchaeia archaeon]